MSRNFIPAVLAIGMGIFGGYYTFQPALRELQNTQRKPSSEQPQSQNDSQLPSAGSSKDSTPTSTQPGSQEGGKQH